MFDYVNKLQLALGDKARRTGLKIAAAALALIGVGFLVAAFWSWLAWYLALGPALASLIVGGLFVLVGLIVMSAGGPERHRMPTSTELKDEVEMRLSQATEAAFDRAKFKAEEAMDTAQARVSSLIGSAGDKVRGVVGLAGTRVQDAAAGAANKAGLTEENVQGAKEALHEAKETLDRAADHRAAPAVGLAGAFAVGLAIASALKSRRSEEDLYYDDDEDEYWV